MSKLQIENLAVYALYICTKMFMCHPNASLPKKAN